MYSGKCGVACGGEIIIERLAIMQYLANLVPDNAMASRTGLERLNCNPF